MAKAVEKPRFAFIARGTIGAPLKWFLLDRVEVAEIGEFPNRGEAVKYAADPEKYTEPEAVVEAVTEKEPAGVGA